MCLKVDLAHGTVPCRGSGCGAVEHTAGGEVPGRVGVEHCVGSVWGFSADGGASALMRKRSQIKSSVIYTSVN